MKLLGLLGKPASSPPATEPSAGAPALWDQLQCRPQGQRFLASGWLGPGPKLFLFSLGQGWGPQEAQLGEKEGILAF